MVADIGADHPQPETTERVVRIAVPQLRVSAADEQFDRSCVGGGIGCCLDQACRPPVEPQRTRPAVDQFHQPIAVGVDRFAAAEFDGAASTAQFGAHGQCHVEQFGAGGCCVVSGRERGRIGRKGHVQQVVVVEVFAGIQIAVVVLVLSRELLQFLQQFWRVFTSFEYMLSMRWHRLSKFQMRFENIIRVIITHRICV